jgi:hypothetical protein
MLAQLVAAHMTAAIATAVAMTKALERAVTGGNYQSSNHQLQQAPQSFSHYNDNNAVEARL